jgi:hypothetical protein
MKSIAKKLAGVFLFAALTLAFSILPSQNQISAKAWYGYVSSSTITQTNAGKSSITLSWAPSKETAQYQISYRASEDYNKDYILAGTTASTSFTIKGLKGGRKYSVRITPVSAAGELGGNAFKEMITLPSKISNLHQEQWWYFIEKVDVSWDKLSGVSGYDVSVYKSGKRIQKKTLNSYSSNYSFSVKNGNIYTVKVRAFTNYNGKKYYSSTATCYCIGQARITKASVANKKLTVKWKKVPGATGYDIFVSTKKNSGYKKVKSVSSGATSATITKFNKKNISAKKNYYIYVRTKKKVGKKTHTSGALYSWNAKTNDFIYL